MRQRGMIKKRYVVITGFEVCLGPLLMLILVLFSASQVIPFKLYLWQE